MEGTRQSLSEAVPSYNVDTLLIDEQNVAPSLLGLPAELRLAIHERCDSPSLMALRSVCRAMHNDLPYSYLDTKLWFIFSIPSQKTLSSAIYSFELLEWLHPNNIHSLRPAGEHVQNLIIDVVNWAGAHAFEMNPQLFQSLGSDRMEIWQSPNLHAIWRHLLYAFPHLKKVVMYDSLHGYWDENCYWCSDREKLGKLITMAPPWIDLTVIVPSWGEIFEVDEDGFEMWGDEQRRILGLINFRCKKHPEDGVVQPLRNRVLQEPPGWLGYLDASSNAADATRRHYQEIRSAVWVRRNWPHVDPAYTRVLAQKNLKQHRAVEREGAMKIPAGTWTLGLNKAAEGDKVFVIWH